MVENIKPEEFRDKLDADEDFYLIDTRPRESFREWHISGAINFTHGEDEKLTVEGLEKFKDVAKVKPHEQVITVCAKGITSADFANQLEKHGFSDVKALAGGMEAWSGVYDRVPIATEANDLTIVQLQRRAKGCLGYLVGSNRAGVAAAVDVSRYTKEFLDAATEKGFKITHVFDTHIHADHISGGRELADKLGVDYHLGGKAEERDPEFDYLPVQKNEVIDVGSVSIKAIHTPGHTTEMTSWLVGTEALISGDSLFANSIGRTELEFQEEARKGADLQYQSLVGKVLSLPDEVKVLPGHFSISNEGEAQDVTPGTPIFASLGHLRKHNEALQMTQEEFVQYIFENVPEKPPNYEEVIATNLGRQKRMSQQKEVELEMGPNRCATSEDSMVG